VEITNIYSNLRRTITKCQWRESSNPDIFTANYSTCTPDINTCPDGNCDSLEKMNHLICPQDCTSNYNYNSVTNIYLFVNIMIMMKMKYLAPEKKVKLQGFRELKAFVRVTKLENVRAKQNFTLDRRKIQKSKTNPL